MKAVSTLRLLPLAILLLPACQQKMAQNPYFRPQEESTFFPDGRSARPLEAGTVARNKLPNDNPLASGLNPAYVKEINNRPAVKVDDPSLPLMGASNKVTNFVDAFPFQLDEDDLKRGQERYTIFCTPCHGPLGNGKGKIVERGFLKPPSYHTDPARSFERFRVNGADGKPLQLKDAPVGYYFEVITKGFGGMADYSAQIPPADRWRIVAYIRALQLSQAANIKDLPEEQQKAAREALGGKQP